MYGKLFHAVWRFALPHSSTHRRSAYVRDVWVLNEIEHAMSAPSDMIIIVT